MESFKLSCKNVSRIKDLIWGILSDRNEEKLAKKWVRLRVGIWLDGLKLLLTLQAQV